MNVIFRLTTTLKYSLLVMFIHIRAFETDVLSSFIAHQSQLKVEDLAIAKDEY